MSEVKGHVRRQRSCQGSKVMYMSNVESKGKKMIKVKGHDSGQKSCQMAY